MGLKWRRELKESVSDGGGKLHCCTAQCEETVKVVT